MEIPDTLFDAIQAVESGGCPDPLNALGDNGRSYGPFQIMKGYWTDAVGHDPSLAADGKTWENTRGPGSVDYSKKVIQAYMNRYATASRLGRPPTNQDIARIHNGGPNGHKKDGTLEYWRKVSAKLGE